MAELVNPVDSGRTRSFLTPQWGPAVILRGLVGDCNFSIISNNCWGGHVYQALQIPYRTPFVGLFIPPKNYLRLLGNFSEYIRSDLVFASASKDQSLNLWRDREQLRYPIGLLKGEVEIHFLHYRTADEANKKWVRRCGRLVDNPKRVFFKFDDREGAVPEDIEAFDRMKIRNKVCFTVARYNARTIIVPAESGTHQVLDGFSLARVSRNYFNTIRWISTLPGWLRLPSLL